MRTFEGVLTLTRVFHPRRRRQTGVRTCSNVDRLAISRVVFARARLFEGSDAVVSDRDAQPPHPSREAPGLGSAPTPARREVAREATPLAGPPGRPRVPESSRAPNQPSGQFSSFRGNKDRVASSDDVAAVRVRVPPRGRRALPPPGGPRVRAGVLRRAVRGGAARWGRASRGSGAADSGVPHALRARAGRGGAAGASARRRGHPPVLRERAVRPAGVRSAEHAAAAAACFPERPVRRVRRGELPLHPRARRARARGWLFIRDPTRRGLRSTSRRSIVRREFEH